MPWFKIDDGFHCHPKVLEAGNEAVGLYARCGSWVAQQLTNGFVPRSIALLYGSSKLTEALVQAGLWVAADGGWQMHDYLLYNPSKDQVEADRASNAERQKRARDRAKQGRNGVTDGVSHGASNADVTGVVTVPPTQPNPTLEAVPSGTASKSGAAKRGARISEDFSVTPDMVEWARTRCPAVNGRRETEKFVNYWMSASGANACKRDWKRTWQNWMMSADDHLPRHLRSLPGGQSDSPWASGKSRFA